jgi:hypothetical protein
MDGASKVEDIVSWMDFNRIEGQMSTAADPAPATFLGGVHDMPFGNTAYFKLILEAGDYLWISEQPTDDATYQRFRVGAAPAPN